MVKRASLISEFWIFVTHNKKWWLIPILLIFALVASLALFSSSPVAPFIYTLF